MPVERATEEMVSKVTRKTLLTMLLRVASLSTLGVGDLLLVGHDGLTIDEDPVVHVVHVGLT